MNFMEKEPNTDKNIEAYKGKLLTIQEYAELPNIREIANGYVFTLEKEGKKLVFMGTKHVNNPNNPLFTQIQDKFNELKPEIVFVEGKRFINTEKDKTREYYKDKTVEECIAEGESTFSLKLAIDAGIDFESPEPSYRKEIKYLVESGYSQVDIHKYYTYRIIYQFQREFPNSTVTACKEYIAKYMQRFREASGWDSEVLAELDESILAEIGIGDNRRYSSQSDPTPWDGVEYTATKQISAASGQYRDEYIFERILSSLDTYNNVLVVYGASHAIIQEPALRAYFEEQL